MKAKDYSLPRSVSVNADDVKPSVAEAFARWQGLGEVRQGAIICEFVGTAHGSREEAYRDLTTGALVNPEDMESLHVVQVRGAKGKTPREYHVFAEVA